MDIPSTTSDETGASRRTGVVSRRPGRLLLAMLAVVVAAAGWVVVAGGDADDDRVLVSDAEGTVSLLDPDASEPVFSVDDAVVLPDRSAILSTVPDGPDTILSTVDAETGVVRDARRLTGRLAVRTISPGGTAAALLAPRAQGLGLYEPEPRLTTEITVAYTDGDRFPVLHRLDGNFEPEIFSLDERSLYLLEFWPPEEPDRYFVRQLDVATGDITDVETPQVDLQPEMRGVARAQALHPDGTFLYTLYTVPAGAEPVHDVAADDGSSERWAFVHVLNLDEGWSFCIFLPLPVGTADEASVGLGLDPDGSTLWVADPSTATLARVDTAELAVTEVRTVESLRPSEDGARAELAVAPDGVVYVASGPTVVGIDPGTWEPVDALAAGATVTGLDVSPDGSTLRLARGSVVVVVDRESGAAVGTLVAPGDSLQLLGPPGDVGRFPLECAC